MTSSLEVDSFAARNARSVDGLTLHYRDYPAVGAIRGLPVVCLHGLTRNARDFENVAPYIAAEGRRVIVADVRGRGRSGRDTDSAHYDIPIYVNDLMTVLESAGIDRCVIVGTSMGGLIGAAFNLIHPGRVAAIVLNDIGPELGARGLQRIAETAGGGESYDTWEQAAAHTERILAHVHPQRAGDRPFWFAYARRLFRESDGAVALDYDPAIAAGLKSGAATPDLWPLFDHLAAIPIQLIWGAESELLESATVEQMRARDPDLRVAVVDGVGHAPTLEEADAEAALKDFLHTVD